jgi:hypothetical protein
MTQWQAKWSAELPVTEEEFEKWCVSDAGIAILLGQISGDAVGIDIDTTDPKIHTAILEAIPPSPVRKQGAKGETLFYRASEPLPSKTWKIAGETIVELLSTGRQTVLPPTIHPDTNQPYRWLTADTMESVPPAELPELTAAVIERLTEVLRPFGYQAEPEREPSVQVTNDDFPEGPFDHLNKLALANLDMWVPALNLPKCQRTRDGYKAVASWRPSSTRRLLDKRGLNLSIVRDGIVDFGDGRKGYTPIDLVMAASARDFDSAFCWLSEIVNPLPDWFPAVRENINKQPRKKRAVAADPSEPISIPALRVF